MLYHNYNSNYNLYVYTKIIMFIYYNFFQFFYSKNLKNMARNFEKYGPEKAKNIYRIFLNH